MSYRIALSKELARVVQFADRPSESYMNLSGDLLNCHLDLFGAMILSVLHDYVRCSSLFMMLV